MCTLPSRMSRVPHMRRALRFVLVLITLSAQLAFASRVDQGTTADGVVNGTAFPSLPCTGFAGTNPSNPSPCDAFALTSFGGYLTQSTSGTTFQNVGAVFVFSNNAGVAGVTVSSSGDLNSFTYGLLSCNFTQGPTAIDVGAPCELADAVVLNSLVSDTLDANGHNDLFTWNPSDLAPKLRTNGPYPGGVAFYIQLKDPGANQVTFSGLPYAPAQTPEPGSALLFASGLGALLTYRRKRS